MQHPIQAWIVSAALIAPVVGAGSPQAPTRLTSAVEARRPYDVQHYAVRLEPDLDAGTVRGTVVVSVFAVSAVVVRIELDRGALTIDAVRELGAPAAFALRGTRIAVELSRPLAPGESRSIEIDYHGAPRFGLELLADRRQAYTIFSTSQWMVCVDDPEDRATLELTVVLPENLRMVAAGRTDGIAAANGMSEHTWRLERPAPTYTFGFVAGAFREVVELHGEIGLRYLADAAQFEEVDVRTIFADTGAMLDFFAARAGRPYPAATYTQALVAETIGQEMSDVSLMSEDWGRRMREDPAWSSLAAHEAAHQWWGNGVTCVDWTHFWLNEGFATFMAAAWMEERFGRERYEEEIGASRARYERVREAGNDKALVFPDWDRPTADDRALVYHKGAWVLHLLREELGEDAFWKGIARYTSKHFGNSVRTSDFQAAMEEGSGRDLAAFFDAWVYGPR